MTTEQETICKIYDRARKLQEPSYDGRMVFKAQRFRIERNGHICLTFGMTKQQTLQAIHNLLNRITL